MENMLDPNSYEQLQGGDADEFRKVYSIFVNKIFVFSLGILNNIHDAEDATARSFSKLWMERLQLQKTEDIGRFLYTNAKRISIDILRERNRRRNVPFDDNHPETISSDETVHPLDVLHGSVVEGLLNAIVMEMEKLRFEYKEVFRLSFIKHHSMKDIAIILDMDLNKAYRCRKSAVRKIRKELKRKGLWVILGFFLLWVHFF